LNSGFRGDDEEEEEEGLNISDSNIAIGLLRVSLA
jgi:hypothetical protein